VLKLAGLLTNENIALVVRAAMLDRVGHCLEKAGFNRLPR
jgi:hypothetical protein